MRAMDRLSEGDGDEPRPETGGASGAQDADGKPGAGVARKPVRVNVRRRGSNAGTPEMRERM